MSDEPLSSRVVGRYLIHEAIASGGMATVHLGRLVGAVGFTRTVAIKRLHAQFARDPDFVSMFTDEARLAARIRHPNVVQTIDVVKSSGELFLVMDYIQGESLSRLCRLAFEGGTAVPVRVTTSILCGVLHGLHAAHEAKSDRGTSLDIVHRDVSPQNVIVGVDGIARVLDFGVAKALGRSHETEEGRLKGKVSYMAPEQIDGKATRRTDIYAASVVLWEVLTQQRLFAGEFLIEVVAKIRDRPMEPPSKYMTAKDLGAIDKSAIDRLDAVTLRGLERRPEDRFETAREMALALEACCGVASPTEVGQWVEATAGKVLDERAKRVAEIESETSAGGPRSVPQPSVRIGSLPPVAAEADTVVDGRRLTDEQMTLQVASVSSPSRSPQKRGLAAFVTITLGVLVAGGLLALSRESTLPHPSLAASSQPAESALDAPPSASASSSSDALAALTADSSASLLSSETVDAASSARPVTPRPPGAHKPDCTTPVTIDSAGRTHFREECLR
jgi:serine/threonine protein kinase